MKPLLHLTPSLHIKGSHNCTHAHTHALYQHKIHTHELTHTHFTNTHPSPHKAVAPLDALSISRGAFKPTHQQTFTHTHTLPHLPTLQVGYQWEQRHCPNLLNLSPTQQNKGRQRKLKLVASVAQLVASVGQLVASVAQLAASVAQLVASVGQLSPNM